LPCGGAKLAAEGPLASPEAVMYSTINHQIMQARVADLHRQAQQDALARAARQGRRPPKHQSGRRVLRLPVITARRVLTAWAVHA
jgi:hypothetical protein